MKPAVPLLLAIIAVGAYLAFRPATKTTTPEPRVENDPTTSVQSPVVELPIQTNRTRIKRTNVDPAVNTNAPREEIEQQIDALNEAAAKNDSDSFQLIITALKDQKPEIRKAALEATIQFGSRDAIPILKELAAKTEDAREKVEILDAIEFLELPSLSEIKRTRRSGPLKP